MKNAITFHGTGCDPKMFWIPYVKSELEKLGYKVFAPLLPDAEEPLLSKWLPFSLNNFKYNKDTVLIGHSAGCPLILSILENIDKKINKAILVSSFVTLHREYKIVQKSYNWEKIKANCENFIFINSDNDPYKCNDKEGRYLFDKLGGMQIIRHGDGHMGSKKFKQPYKKFPLLVKLATDD